jgi:hypothetical protein
MSLEKEDEMLEMHFRFRGYSEERLWAARWHLFEFPDVRNLGHLHGDVVAIVYDGDPEVDAWIALLRGRGFDFAPLVYADPELDAA